ncbi:MAG: hypothetical protein ABIS01_05135 [Ferruginibacter sp.]
MNTPGNPDLLAEFKKLSAINKSQEARLEECAKIVNSRENEIELLQAMLSEATAYRSSMDSQLKELKSLQDYLRDIRQQVSASAYFTGGSQQQVDDTINVEQQFQHLQLEYTYLQSQLSDLQIQLLNVNQRSLALQQQNSRIAELESLLEIAKEELTLLKGPVKHHG